MGKDFYKEIQGLEQIHNCAMTTNVDIVSDFLKRYFQTLFWAVGSGGSYSTAAVFEYLCIKAGWKAHAITPLELSQLEYQIQSSAVLLFTAGGSNNDTKNAYQYISDLEPDGMLTCCMRMDAAIKKIQKKNLHNYYYEYKMPVVKDGYLAVESLFSSIILLTRAFEAATGNNFFLLPQVRKRKKSFFEQQAIKDVLGKETVIVLHGGITTPAAIDLESKFSEVSLGNVQLVDFRNFAHGRHYWLSDRRGSTSIIALVGHAEQKLADKTLKLLPEDIPTIRMDIVDDTVEGLIEAFEGVLELVLKAGESKGINPGKPHVEEFGRKLYHLNYNISKNSEMNARRKDVTIMAAYRKSYMTNGHYLQEYITAGRKYLNRLLSQRFKGIIFDYDGTLHDKNGNNEMEQQLFNILNKLLEKGIRLGIATGRGKSVRKELQRVIDKKFWDEILIAYYNGGVIGKLADASQPDKSAGAPPEAFERIAALIIPYIQRLNVDGLDDQNPYQLTIMADGEEHLYWRLLKEQIAEMKDIKVISSSHSIDIVPLKSSKNNIFDYWANWGYDRDDFLIIGDSGQFGGNDYELLKNSCALSVDYVSEALESCWNFAHPGLRNLEATKSYLDMIETGNDGTFKLIGAAIHEV